MASHMERSMHEPAHFYTPEELKTLLMAKGFKVLTISHPWRYTIEAIKDEVRKNIDIYLEQLRKKWWKTETEEIINIKIACAIAGTEGVLDVSEVKLNGKFGNLITQNEEIPILGDLNIYD